jgi:hypothetical protein
VVRSSQIVGSYIFGIGRMDLVVSSGARLRLLVLVNWTRPSPS